MPILEFDNISFHPLGEVVVSHVTLALPHGESIAIIGGSGRGKSTIIRLAMGLIRPTQGRIRFGDNIFNDLSDRDLTALRRDSFGAAAQNPHIIPALSVQQNVALALNLRAPHAKNKKQLVIEALEMFQIAHRASHYVDHLSGGEQRRVSLARAIVGHPQILFLDEPTSGLDGALATALTDVIFDYAGRNRTSLVIATHDANLSRRCDYYYDLGVRAQTDV